MVLLVVLLLHGTTGERSAGGKQTEIPGGQVYSVRPAAAAGTTLCKLHLPAPPPYHSPGVGSSTCQSNPAGDAYCQRYSFKVSSAKQLGGAAMGNRSFGGKLVFQLPLRGLAAVVAGDAAAAWPGTAAVGPQTGQLRDGGSPDGGARLGLSFALHLPQPPFLFPFFAGIHSIPPACGRDRRVQGRIWFPDTVSREEIPSQFGEKSKALPAETQILHFRKPNLPLTFNNISAQMN